MIIVCRFSAFDDVMNFWSSVERHCLTQLTITSKYYQAGGVYLHPGMLSKKTGALAEVAV